MGVQVVWETGWGEGEREGGDKRLGYTKTADDFGCKRFKLFQSIFF